MFSAWVVVAKNISGTVNGVNITSSSVSVLMSQDIHSFLSGYNASNVTNGSYNVSLADVQSAFSSVQWGAPVQNTTDTVIMAGDLGLVFSFADQTAHLFSLMPGMFRLKITTCQNQPV